jgi:hypothetical protein
MDRRQFLKLTTAAGAALFVPWSIRLQGEPAVQLANAFAKQAANVLSPGDIPKYETPMLIPPVMPLIITRFR